MSVVRNPHISAAQAKASMAQDRAKAKFPEVLAYEDVVGFCFSAAERQDEKVLHFFNLLLTKDSALTYDEKAKTIVYKPPYPVRDSKQLIAFFQNNNEITSIDVVQLKKGWPNCEEAIDQLEREHKILVIRKKKDNVPTVIFADDPSLHIPLDQDFRTLWQSVQLPERKDDIIRFLLASHRTPAGQIAEAKVVAKVAKKARKNRQSTKQTNKHMSSIFKDYSGLKPRGK